ncbi:MAG: 50S ribosomal protein L20, partial [Candidatus Omnitrophica bacterium]|nr:50S ribosomal protein L20 [Candidatus Omnitrophota bacterium]
SAKRRKKVLKAAKGARGGRSKLLRTAKETVQKGLSYAYRDRKAKKRDYRVLWITRITAGCKKYDILYSRFIKGLKEAKIELNRKMLSELAATDDNAFSKLIKLAKEGK